VVVTGNTILSTAIDVVVDNPASLNMTVPDSIICWAISLGMNNVKKISYLDNLPFI